MLEVIEDPAQVGISRTRRTAIGLSGLMLLAVPLLGLAANLPNRAADLLYTGDRFAVHKFASRAQQVGGFSEWCNDYSFKVSVVFDVEESFVLTRGYLFDALYEELLPRLKDEHCPNAKAEIQSEHYLKGIYFKSNGERTSLTEAQQSPVANARVSTAIYRAQFDQHDSAPRPVPSQVLVSYSTRIHSKDPAEIDQELGSLEALQSFYARGRMSKRRYAASQQERTDKALAREALLGAAAARFNVDFVSEELAYVLQGEAERLVWSRPKRLNVLQTYVRTTSRLCADETPSPPTQTRLRWVVEGEDPRDTGHVIWYSARLQPVVDGLIWGNAIHGLFELDQATKSDIEALVRTQGCGSSPLKIIEDYFLVADELHARTDSCKSWANGECVSH